MQVDYIIAGQGTAGSMLAYSLMQAGQSVAVIDRLNHTAASHVAAGIINPIIGKRLNIVWQGATLLPFAEKFYRSLEQTFGHRLYVKKNTVRIFRSAREAALVAQKSEAEDYARYLVAPNPSLAPDRAFHAPYGYVEICDSAIVDTRTLLALFRSYFARHCELRDDIVKSQELELDGNGLRWKDIKARRVVFCEGYRGMDNPYFAHLPWAPVKGEMLIVEAQELHPDAIINGHLTMAPQGDQRWWVGTTFNWDDINEQPSEVARTYIEATLRSFMKLNFTTLDHKAGVRPATSDRLPFIGVHPEFPAIGIFNGMGAKGTLVAPYYAGEFVKTLEFGAALESEVDIRRCMS